MIGRILRRLAATLSSGRLRRELDEETVSYTHLTLPTTSRV